MLGVVLVSPRRAPAPAATSCPAAGTARAGPTPAPATKVQLEFTGPPFRPEGSVRHHRSVMSAANDATTVPLELTGAVDGLTEEFTGVFAREAIADCVRDSYDLLRPARVEAFLPLLAHRFARQRLRAAAVSQGLLPHSVPEVLFVCTRNAGRSQLAAALLEHEAGGRVVVRSAGTAPSAAVQPEVLQVLAEVGIDAAGAYPKPLTDESVAAADVVVTMGCGDSCPVLPGRRYLDWELADPHGAPLEAVRSVRNDITDRVRSLLAELDAAQAAR
jgi:arsenate reductase